MNVDDRHHIFSPFRDLYYGICASAFVHYEVVDIGFILFFHARNDEKQDVSASFFRDPHKSCTDATFFLSKAVILFQFFYCRVKRQKCSRSATLWVFLEIRLEKLSYV